MIVRKLLVSDGHIEREVLLVGTIVVGRDPSCQLNDLDPLLSRRHAEFIPTGKGVTVRDLKSRNGILVNGAKVPEHALKPGDVIQLGHLHVRYVEEAVVKSPEDHTRVRAKTETGIEIPTMAPVARPAAPASVPMAAAAEAPTSMAPAAKPAADTNLDATTVPAARSAAPALPRMPPAPKVQDDDLDATAAPGVRPSMKPPATEDLDVPVASLNLPPSIGRVHFDGDTTVAPASPRPFAKPAAGKDDDADATRVPWAKATAVAD